MLHKKPFFLAVVLMAVTVMGGQSTADEMRIGIIGLDTSHSPAFTELLNATGSDAPYPDMRVVAAYPKGSLTIESSYSRIPRYTEAVQEHGVEIVDSIEALLKRVDAVLLTTNDGKRHLEQARQVIEAGKPVFVDKPIAASLSDAVAIFEEAERHDVPLFSSSSLRYTENAQAIRNGAIGDVVGADVYSPANLEETHPDLYWYGVHGVEMLFTVMGTGCETVRRVQTEGTEIVVGQWDDGRLGIFRGIREGEGGYGGTAFGAEGITQVGPYEGYKPLLDEIVDFFRTGEVPVSKEETLEIFAFMTAADKSKEQGGAPVAVREVLEEARRVAASY